MFLNGNKTIETSTAFLYEVEDLIIFQLGENKYTSKASAVIHLGRNEHYKNQIILNRTGFKIDDKEVEKKFPKISNLYFSSVFPLILTYHEGNYLVAEFKETAQRIMENDLILRSNYSGDGFEYIRDEFLNKVKNQNVYQQLIEQLPVYQVLNMSAFPKFKKEEFPFKWNIAGLGVIEAIGNFRLDSEENKISIVLKNINEVFIKEMVEDYILENKILLSFAEDEFPEISFDLETTYLDSLNSIQNSKVELMISIGEKFRYTQNFLLTLSPKNN